MGGLIAISLWKTIVFKHFQQMIYDGFTLFLNVSTFHGFSQLHTEIYCKQQNICIAMGVLPDNYSYIYSRKWELLKWLIIGWIGTELLFLPMPQRRVRKLSLKAPYKPTRSKGLWETTRKHSFWKHWAIANHFPSLV